MRVETHIQKADVRITDDEGNVVLAVQVEYYNLVLDTAAAIVAVEEFLTKAKELSYKL